MGYRYGELPPSASPDCCYSFHFVVSNSSLEFWLKSFTATMMAFPEPPSFYPVMRMPAVDRPVPRNVCPPLRPFMPPSPPQSFQALNMQSSPMFLPPKSFPPPPPHMLPLPPPTNLPLPPGIQNHHTAPIQLPPNMQRPFTPPSSAPPTPPPIMDLSRQNEILTQRVCPNTLKEPSISNRDSGNGFHQCFVVLPMMIQVTSTRSSP